MEQNEIELNTEPDELIQSFILQINELATSHSNNKKNYTGLSKKLVSLFNQVSENEIQDINIELVDQIKTISTTNNKIRSSIYSIRHTFLSLESNQISQNFEKSLKSKFSTIRVQISNINNILNEFDYGIEEINHPFLHKISSKDFEVSSKPLSFYVDLKPFEIRDSRIKSLTIKNNEIYKKTLLLLEDFSKIKIEILDLKNKISEKNNFDYIERFKEDTDLILKKYELYINNITNKLENRIGNIHLNHTELVNNHNLLKSGLESSLTSLSNLNERTQNIELEFSKILDTQTEKVETDLNGSRNALMEIVESIKTDANTKLDEINTAHADFKNLVEKAGIYELTQNYKIKADEEKKDYKLNMWLTIGAIALAIIATIAVITIPIIEHWKASPPVPTDYFTLFARLSISIMFFVLALYTSKQASKHYECYQENHRTFLQLAALEPFMTRMSHDEQKEIRKGLIPSYFNQSADGKFASKGDEVDMAMMFTFMDKLSNFGQSKKDTKPGESVAAETKPQG